MNTINIFKPGKHTAMSGAVIEFTEADVKATADAYDPSHHKAPLVVGHPKTDDPAYGWAASLQYSDGMLRAVPEQVVPEFADAVNAGRYKYVSASFYPPEHPSNPVPNAYYLRHIGFLGAQPPAVKGLGEARFADADLDDDLVTIQFAQARKPAVNPALPAVEFDDPPEFSDPPENPPMPDNDIDPAVAQREAELAEREAELTKREKALLKAEFAEFAETLVKDGKLLPRQKQPATELLFAMSATDTQVIEFGEGDAAFKGNAAELLKAFLNELPKQIEYGEISAPSPDDAPVMRTQDAPSGYHVDPKRAGLHQRALAYQEKHGVDYVTAVAALEHS